LTDTQLADYARGVRSKIDENLIHEIFLEDWAALREPVALLCANLQECYREILLRRFERDPSGKHFLREAERLHVLEQWLADHPPAAQDERQTGASNAQDTGAAK
jgi:hypothetical protein